MAELDSKAKSKASELLHMVVVDMRNIVVGSVDVGV